jgi:hypothetical protein
MKAQKAGRPSADVMKGFRQKQILLPLNFVSSIFGRIPVPVSRFIVLFALGSSMVWLFSPHQKSHQVPSGINRVEAVDVSASLETAPATEVVHKPDPLMEQPDSSTASSSPSESPSNSRSEKSNPDEKKPANLARSNHPKSPSSISIRHLSPNHGKAALVDSRYPMYLRRGIAAFKIRLISLLRRSSLSGNRHHKRSDSSR